VIRPYGSHGRGGSRRDMADRYHAGLQNDRSQVLSACHALAHNSRGSEVRGFISSDTIRFPSLPDSLAVDRLLTAVLAAGLAPKAGRTFLAGEGNEA
jgi:hypothetical protein